MVSLTEQPSTEPGVTAMPPMIASLIESAAASFETDPSASRQFLYRASALLRARSSAREPHANGPEPSRIRGRLAFWQANRVLACIDDNLASGIQASDLARLVNLSTSHFFRAFKASLGTTPSKYVARRRVELAIEMIGTTQEPLSQIAAQCGFCDQSHLCRLFRRLVGQSPNEWRRANGPGPSRVHESRALSRGNARGQGVESSRSLACERSRVP
jgi:AraC family transcriptional regulator